MSTPTPIPAHVWATALPSEVSLWGDHTKLPAKGTETAMSVAMTTTLKTGEIALISAVEHTKGHKRKLRALGVEPLLLGADPASIPRGVRVVVARIEGSSHRGTAAAYEWARAAEGNERVFFNAKGAGRMICRLQELGFVSAEADALVQEEPTDVAPQRADYAHDGAFFGALIAHHGSAPTVKAAHAICTAQGASFKRTEYTQAVRLWASAHGVPVPAFAAKVEEEAEEPPEVTEELKEDTRPYLNDVPHEGTVAGWCAALVALDPWITSGHVRLLAREKGITASTQSTFAVAVKRWRAANGLGDVPIPRTAGLSRPVCWEPTLGDDPANWPEPRMRPVPTIADLRAEITLWEQEVEAQKAKLAAAKAAHEAAMVAAKASRKASMSATTTSWVQTQEALEATQAKLAETEEQLLDAKREYKRSLGCVTAKLRKDAAAVQARMQTELSHTVERCDAQQKQYRALEGALGRSQAALKEARETVRVRDRACAALKAQITRLEVQPVPETAEIRRVRGELREAKDAARAEKQQLDALLRESQSATYAANREAAEAKVAQVEEHEANEALTREIERLQRRLEAVSMLGAPAAPAAALAPQAQAEALLYGARKAHGLMQVLGVDMTWEKLEAVLRAAL